MTNNRVRSGVGPAPASSRAGLSASRIAILQRLDGQPEPTTIAALVRATGLHHNTLREHLTALVDAGLVRRWKAEAVGRGRPAWLYESTGMPEPDADYARLASTLAGVIAQSSPDPARAARDAGEQWGRELIADRGVEVGPGHSRTLDRPDARDAVVTLLRDLGFAPEREAASAEVRLTRCPLLEAAHRHPEIVCGVHLGIVRGALAGLGTDPEGSELVPFAEPGACVLRLP